MFFVIYFNFFSECLEIIKYIDEEESKGYREMQRSYFVNGFWFWKRNKL